MDVYLWDTGAKRYQVIAPSLSKARDLASKAGFPALVQADEPRSQWALTLGAYPEGCAVFKSVPISPDLPHDYRAGGYAG